MLKIYNRFLAQTDTAARWEAWSRQSEGRGKRKPIAGRFIAPRKKGSSSTEVYARKSGKRLPLKTLFGPGIMQLFKQRENAIILEIKVKERLPVEFMQSRAYYMAKIRR